MSCRLWRCKWICRERYCFNEELGYIGSSLIAEVNGVSGVVKSLDIFLKETVL
ncbi:MAG: hypothetical protein HFH68_01555 [Lachnospiraceae bacterium]|nr:hypothetical protein [Lachnospiraceae bacterium]